MEAYANLGTYLKKGPWWVDVHMETGQITWPVFNSLAAFWPGVQVLVGDVEEATATLHSFFSIWRKYKSLPEGCDLGWNRTPLGL